MYIDICFQTTAASRNKHVAAVWEVLNAHNIRGTGQYRGDRHYGVFARSVPQETIDAIEALSLPDRVVFKVSADA